MNGTSFYIWGVESPFRIACFQLVTNKYFEHLILILILISSATLAYQNPYMHSGANKYSDSALVLALLDKIFLVIFTLELVAKHIASAWWATRAPTGSTPGT